MESPEADEYSYQTQNFSGTVAAFGPLLFTASLALSGGIAPMLAIVNIGVDLTLFAQTAAWNGLATELSHWISQRPRPFVYTDPAQRGLDPSHYTSFYSGHTSFAAAAGTCLVLTLFGRGAPSLLLLLTSMVVEILVFSTAIFRVMAGRHFVTDVLCGALAGSLIALAVALIHRRDPRKQKV